MEKTYSLLKPLTDQLMKDVRAYGILEVSTEQYQTSCNQILNFAQLSQIVGRRIESGGFGELFTA